MKRIKKAGVVPAPFYTYAHYHGNKWPDYGEEKMQWMVAHRSFLDYDIPVAPASDYTPGPFEPLMAIQSMVTRKDVRGRVWGPSQRISVTEALRICTVHGAYSSFEENIKGSLEKHGSSLGEVVKCTVFLADIKEWGAMNEVYKTYFPVNPPARSALGSSGLALDARVEIECLATVGLD